MPDSPQNTSERTPADGPGITVRSVALGAVLMLALAFAIPYNDYYLAGTFITGNHLPLGCVFILTVLVLVVNTVLKSLRNGWQLRPSELIVVWCMMIVPSGIPSSGLSRYFYSMLVGPFYYATEENQWDDLMLRHVPKWLVPSTDGRSDVVRFFFEGLPEDMGVPWGAWVRPLLVWSIFIALLYFIMFCLCVILRKQWVQREKLSFPLMQLPLEITQAPEGKSLLNAFFRNRIVWIGFAIPVVIHTVNGLHKYFPNVPMIPMLIRVNQLFTESPWNAMQLRELWIYPSVVGFVYLLTLEVSFSFWFFFLFLQLELMLGALFGNPLGGNWSPFAVHQQAGAFLVFAGLLCWRLREHLKDVARKAWASSYPVSDAAEPFSYRLAFWGLIFGTLLISGWCAVAGMSFFYSFIATWLMIAILIVLTRLVAQGGLLFIYQNFSPYDLLTTAVGGASISASTLTLLAMQNVVFIHDARESMMPSILNAFKVADESKVKQRSLVGALVLSIVIATVASGAFFLYLTYTYGGSNLDWFGMRAVFGFKLGPWSAAIRHPRGTNWTNVRYLCYGAALMTFLFKMGGRYYWWPLHPLGLLMANSYAMTHFWFSIMMGWFIKLCILKYGGGRTYKRLRPGFFGVVLGECFIGGVWIIIGFLLGKGAVRIRIMPG